MPMLNKLVKFFPHLPIKGLEFLLNAVIYGLVVYLLSSTYYTNKIKLFISLLMLCYFTYNWRSNKMKKFSIDANLYPLVILFILFYGFLASFSYIDLHEISKKEIEWIYNRIILITINFTFSIAVFYFITSKTYQQIIDLMFFVAALNGIVAIAQFVFPDLSRSLSGRMTLLSMEPNHAALHYMSVFWLVIYNNSSFKLVNYFARSFVIFGLLVRSKIQLFTILVSASIRSLKMLIFSLFLSVFIFNFSLLIDNFSVDNEKPEFCEPSTLCDQTYWVSDDLQSFSRFIMGNQKSIEIKPSYYIRLFSSYYSFKSLNENPLGIGWGSFNTYFQRHSSKSGLQVNMIGGSGEYQEIHAGMSESTSKSSLLEIVVATGICAILPLLVLSIYMFRHRRKNKGVFLTFLSLLVAGMWIETSPFLALLTVTYVLMRKSVIDE